MTPVSEVEQLALKLPVSERAALATSLLRSLPPILHDEDEGFAEATRRRDELLANPSIGISHDELRDRISKRFDI